MHPTGHNNSADFVAHVKLLPNHGEQQVLPYHRRQPFFHPKDPLSATPVLCVFPHRLDALLEQVEIQRLGRQHVRLVEVVVYLPEPLDRPEGGDVLHLVFPRGFFILPHGRTLREPKGEGVVEALVVPLHRHDEVLHFSRTAGLVGAGVGTHISLSFG
jgi:hypothetical protein